MALHINKILSSASGQARLFQIINQYYPHHDAGSARAAAGNTPLDPQDEREANAQRTDSLSHETRRAAPAVSDTP